MIGASDSWLMSRGRRVLQVRVGEVGQLHGRVQGRYVVVGHIGRHQDGACASPPSRWNSRGSVALAGRLVLVAALCGCQAEPDADRSAPPDTSGPATATARVPDSDRTIHAGGIGSARIGMTIGALRTELPPGMTLGARSPYMVDIDALPVIQGADTLYHVLIGAGEPTSDDTAIDLLATTHAAFRTADGIGPGSTLAQAAVAWGEPSLSYNTNDESREWAEFTALPASILIRVQPASDTASFAGVYATEDEFNQTSRYDPTARIGMVMVRRP